MSDITLIVRIRPKPEHREAFLARLLVHAENCRKREPGCRRFEVYTALDEGDDRIFLVETYGGEEALRAHRESSHMKEYREATNPLIEHREIVESRRVSP